MLHIYPNFRSNCVSLKDVANRTVQAVRQDSSLLLVKTIAILIDNFFPSNGKMSQEHDSSDEGSIEGPYQCPTTGKLAEKAGALWAKKKERAPVHPSFRAPGPPTAEGWGFIRGFASSSTVHWSLRDLATIFNVSMSTLRGGLTRIPGGYTQNIVLVVLRQSKHHKYFPTVFADTVTSSSVRLLRGGLWLSGKSSGFISKGRRFKSVVLGKGSEGRESGDGG